MPRHLSLILALLLVLLVAPIPITAQDRPPQLLYRKDGLLYLANAITGETTVLEGIAADDFSKWYWSPNGYYLLALFRKMGESGIGVYDLQQQRFLLKVELDEPVFAIQSGAWSPDNLKISYSMNSPTQGELRLLTVATGEQALLYSSPKSEVGTGVEQQWWSPNGNHLLFTHTQKIVGGHIVLLSLTSLDAREPNEIYGEYYASYNPAWSPNENWILLTLHENYIARHGFKDDLGDVFLYSIHDDVLYQVTHTLFGSETNLRWSPDGQHIQFEVNQTLITVALQDVLNHASHNLPMQIEPLPQSQPVFGKNQVTSPDAAFISYLDEHLNLWVTDLALEYPHRIDQLASPTDFLGWRP